MLRLISIIGIAIAMVIGFVAISTKMKDDYTVRARVVDVLQQMKNVAAGELACEKSDGTTNLEKANGLQNQTPAPDDGKLPQTEVPAEPRSTPLIDSTNEDSQQIITDGNSEQSQTSEEPSTGQSSPEESTSEAISEISELQNSGGDELTASETDQNNDIIRSLGYRMPENGLTEVVVVFSDVYGESGKLQINAGSHIMIRCKCAKNNMSCKTVESNINKNYLPKSLTK